MTYTYDDPELAEVQEQLLLREAETPKKGFGTLPPTTRLIILVAFGIISFATWIGKVSPRKGIGMLVVLMVILFFVTRDPVSRKPLSRPKLQLLLNQQIQTAKLHPIGDIPQIPRDTMVQVTNIGRRYHYPGTMLKDSFAVILYHASGIEEWVLAMQDSYEGHNLTWNPRPQGVSGDEARDLTYVPMPQMSSARWLQSYLRPRR